MLITDYTTYDEVRAALGVSATELPDTVLSQPQYALMLSISFDDVNEGITTLYPTISALLVGSRSAAQQRLYDYARLYATYAIARDLLTSLPLFSVSRLSDGRAEFTRQTDIFEDVRQAVQGVFNKLRLKVSAAYVALTPGAVAYSQLSFEFTSSTGIATDPVTNA